MVKSMRTEPGSVRRKLMEMYVSRNTSISVQALLSIGVSLSLITDTIQLTKDGTSLALSLPAYISMQYHADADDNH